MLDRQEKFWGMEFTVGKGGGHTVRIGLYAHSLFNPKAGGSDEHFDGSSLLPPAKPSRRDRLTAAFGSVPS
ncbi:hypothetical protein GTW25_19300 [Aliihoeflea aestuarii]|jgi:hypothetical protein|uniref:hypothetical protein n=1 Tax=Aliihoeflea aestuarii TaxID=453840 RepID=UPI002095F71E|nr:hypothetical protein [Aliihoeflea aestuarii]MCO6393170.1 hypothetical protein [Aliihoeflea aestuarii]